MCHVGRLPQKELIEQKSDAGFVLVFRGKLSGCPDLKAIKDWSRNKALSQWLSFPRHAGSLLMQAPSCCVDSNHITISIATS